MADNAGSKGGLNPIAQQYIVACTILPLLAVISVGLRLATKTIKGTRMGGDDYTIIACLVIAMILSIIGLHAAAMEYVGKPFDTLNAEELKTRARVRKETLFAKRRQPLIICEGHVFRECPWTHSLWLGQDFNHPVLQEDLRRSEVQDDCQCPLWHHRSLDDTLVRCRSPGSGVHSLV